MIKRIERSSFKSLTSKRLLPISRLIGYAIHVVARMGHRRIAADAAGCFKAAGRSPRTFVEERRRRAWTCSLSHGTVDIEFSPSWLPKDFTTVRSALSYNCGSSRWPSAVL
jgi:hypothetical protein